MSEEEKDNQENQGPDLNGLKNELSESFNEKFESLAQTLAQQQANQQQIVEALRQSVAKPQATEEEKDFYDMKPREFEEQLVNRVGKLIDERTNTAIAKSQQKQEALYSVYSEYPEIGQAGSAMNKKMLEYHKGLPQHMQETPEGYRLAALQAAQELDVKPKSKRKGQSNDDFSFGGASNNPNRGRKAATTELNENQKAFAKLLGRDVDSKEYKEKMAEILKRDTYSRFK